MLTGSHRHQFGHSENRMMEHMGNNSLLCQWLDALGSSVIFSRLNLMFYCHHYIHANISPRANWLDNNSV